MDAQEIAKELVLSGHPRLSNIDLPDDDPRRNFQLYDLIFQIIGISRSLIVERCTNLKNLTFNSEMSFPFNLSGSPQPIFSDRLSSIKTVEFALGEHEDRKIWTGRQALALLIFLPSLQSASLVFKLNHKDARIINTHLPSLIKSKRSLSKVKNLSLRIHHQLPKRNHQFFDCNSTMKTFISIFDRLENFTLKSYEDPMMSNPMFPAALRESRREQHPTMSVLEGLNSSALSLKSLSVEGLFQTEEMGKEFHSCLERMKNLEHLRMDGLSFGSLVDLYLVNRGPNLLVSDGEKTCWMLPDCKTFELADNYVPNSEGLEDISGLNAEIFLVTMLKEGFFPRENLRLIRSPRLVTPQPRESDWQRHAFKFEDTRKVLVNEASELGIEVEYV